MNSFNSVLDNILDLSRSGEVEVLGEKKKILGIAKYATKNFPNSFYYKVAFDNHAMLAIVPETEELMYSKDCLGSLPGVSNEQIGKLSEVNYQEKVFKLENGNDYQRRTDLIFGEIEGDCEFSDYVFEGKTKEVLSLAVMADTKKRSDYHTLNIETQDFKF